MVYDAVIIGAGPSGLAAAARLAHFGVKACLVEAHSRLGGLNSWHRVAGREISSGLHAFTNYAPDGKGPLGKLLRQLRIKLSDLELHPQGGSSIRFPSATLRFTNDQAYLDEQVASVFPRRIDAFRRLRRHILATDEGEVALRQSSARDVLESFLGDPLLVDMLFCPVMFYGNPGGVGDGNDGDRERPDMDWLLFCVLWKCIFESGLARPRRGMRPLWEMLARRIRDGGGDILMPAKVDRILVDAGEAIGVRLADGREVCAGMVFSSAGAVETSALLPDGRGNRPGAGAISIVEGIAVLDRPSQTAGMADTAIFYSSGDELAFARPDGLTERRSGVVIALDNYLVPGDGQDPVVKMAHLANYDAWRSLPPREYKLAKAAAAKDMAGDLAKLGIDLSPARARTGAYGCFDDMFTPLTIERFTCHAQGALYGSPTKSRSGDTAVENLYLIGADQGFHGIVGAMLSGVAMVNAHFFAKRRPATGYQPG